MILCFCKIKSLLSSTWAWKEMQKLKWDCVWLTLLPRVTLVHFLKICLFMLGVYSGGGWFEGCTVGWNLQPHHQMPLNCPHWTRKTEVKNKHFWLWQIFPSKAKKAFDKWATTSCETHCSHQLLTFEILCVHFHNECISNGPDYAVCGMTETELQKNHTHLYRQNFSEMV